MKTLYFNRGRIPLSSCGSPDSGSCAILYPILPTVKPVLSGPHTKRTPSFKRTPAAWVPKFSSHIYCETTYFGYTTQQAVNKRQ